MINKYKWRNIYEPDGLIFLKFPHHTFYPFLPLILLESLSYFTKQET